MHGEMMCLETGTRRPISEDSWTTSEIREDGMLILTKRKRLSVRGAQAKNRVLQYRNEIAKRKLDRVALEQELIGAKDKEELVQTWSLMKNHAQQIADLEALESLSFSFVENECTQTAVIPPFRPFKCRIISEGRQLVWLPPDTPPLEIKPDEEAKETIMQAEITLCKWSAFRGPKCGEYAAFDQLPDETAGLVFSQSMGIFKFCRDSTIVMPMNWLNGKWEADDANSFFFNEDGAIVTDGFINEKYCLLQFDHDTWWIVKPILEKIRYDMRCYKFALLDDHLISVRSSGWVTAFDLKRQGAPHPYYSGKNWGVKYNVIVHQGWLYVIGGSEQEGRAVYRSKGLDWEDCDPLQQPRHNPTLGVYNGKLMVFSEGQEPETYPKE